MRDDAEICRRLEAIYASIDTCQHCSLGKLPINDGRHMRYKPGNVDGPRVVVVAQNPGKSKKGDHVWGGLDLLFKADPKIKELAEEVWITNIVKCCTRSNKKPEPEEIRACEGWLRQEIEVIQPDKIIALGKVASMWLRRTFPDKHSDWHPRYIQFKPKERAEYIERLKRAMLRDPAQGSLRSTT